MRRVLLPHHISEDPAPAGGVIRDFAGRSMGTSWSVRLVAAPEGSPGHLALDHLQHGLQRQLDAIVAEMSHWETDSDLGRFNRAGAGTWLALPPAFFDVLSFAIGVARDSGGACVRSRPVVGRESFERVRQRRDVAGIDQQTGVPDDFRKRSAVRCDHRDSGRHRLEGRQAETLIE